MKTIEIIVSPKGETTVTTRGFSGSSCREASKFVEQALGQGYDHFQPASYLLKEQANLLPKASDQSWDRFEALFRKINDALS